MSGVIYTGYDNNTRFYMRWWLVGQETANNRSLVGWEIGLQGVAGRSAYWYSNAIRINSGYLNGAQVSDSSTYSNITIQGDGLRPLRSGSLWIGHNSDGGKSFGMSMSGWLYGGGDKSASGSFGLPTIPRGADPSTDKGSYTIGEPITIYTNRKSTSFSHTVRLENVGGGGSIRSDFNSVGDSVTWTPTQAEIDLIQSRIPNSNTYTLQIAVYNNQVGEWRRIQRNLTITNANPTFTNFTFKDNNAATVAITGSDQVLVKGKSTLLVTVPSADKMVAIKSSTPSHYAIAYDGASNQVNYATTDVTTSFSSISTTGNRTVQVTAYDSRSNTTRVAKNVTVYDYAAPTITTTLTRENNFGSNTTLHIEGTYTPLNIGGVDKNSIVTGSLQYRYKESSVSTWGAWTTRAFTAANGAYSITDFVITLDNQKKFDFEFKVSDNFGTVTATNSVDVGVPIMFVGESNGSAAIGINKMPESGALDVQGDVYSNGKKLALSIDYSTTEQIIGLSWIDGKIIYRKSVDLGSMPNNNSKSVAHGVIGIDRIVSTTAMVNNGTNYFPLPYAPPGDMAFHISLYATKTSVVVQTGTDRTSYSGYAMIEYTKT